MCEGYAFGGGSVFLLGTKYDCGLEVLSRLSVSTFKPVVPLLYCLAVESSPPPSSRDESIRLKDDEGRPDEDGSKKGDVGSTESSRSSCSTASNVARTRSLLDVQHKHRPFTSVPTIPQEAVLR